MKFEKISFEQFEKDCNKTLSKYCCDYWKYDTMINGKFTQEGLQKMYDEIQVPTTRATSGSAGYDLAAAMDIYCPESWSFPKNVLIPTGLKIQLDDGFVGKIYNRSSNAKNNMMLANNVAVIDSDYYNNKDNEGHIFISMFWLNYQIPFEIKRGTRIAQMLIERYYKIEESDININLRSGGFGSTGNE